MRALFPRLGKFYFYQKKVLPMEKNLLEDFGKDAETRVENALAALRTGKGILVTDDESRENEGDLIFAAETLTVEQIAMQIRDCSGIICICITPKRAEKLGLPMMVPENTSRYGTAFPPQTAWKLFASRSTKIQLALILPRQVTCSRSSLAMVACSNALGTRKRRLILCASQASNLAGFFAN